MLKTCMHESVSYKMQMRDDTVQLNLNFTHTCRHTRVLARLMCVKLQKLACAHTVARNFGVRTLASEHM